MFHTVAGVDNGEAMHVLGQEVYGKSLCLPLNFILFYLFFIFIFYDTLFYLRILTHYFFFLSEYNCFTMVC